jgi:hypothetical protein
LGLPPSMTETQLFVVPRSMPITFAIFPLVPSYSDAARAAELLISWAI